MRKRPDPNVIAPGDELFIPDPDEKNVPCSTGSRHRFVCRAKPNVKLRLVLRDPQGKAIGNVAFSLVVGKEEVQGTTGDDGLIECEVSSDVSNATLQIKKWRVSWNLAIGHLDPSDDGGEMALITGVQARLNNLGYHCGPVDGVCSSRTITALKRFQRRVLGRNEPDGEPDHETREALRREYGC